MTAYEKRRLELIWNCKCTSCDATPVVRFSGLCGPCTFGEVDTLNGEWWDKNDDAELVQLEKAARA